jgi:hypothetical protein
MKNKLNLLFSLLLITTTMTAQDLDRANWTVTTLTGTGYTHVPDGTTGLPEHILDDNTATFLSLVKPGKSYSPISSQPAGFMPSFTVDMQIAQTFDYIKWRHRSGNSYKYLRVYGVDIEISNDGTNFTKINTDIVWIPNVDGYAGASNTADPKTYKIDIPQSTSRYIRVKLIMWSDIYDSLHPDHPGTGPAAGSTMQIAEFGVGKTESSPGLVKRDVTVNLGEGIANVTPAFARVDDGAAFTAVFKLKTDYQNPTVTGGATIEDNRIHVASVTSDMTLSISATKEQADILTPYPTEIEINQINSAEKERIRLCQGHKKYDKQPTGFYVEAGKKVEVNVEILAQADRNVMPVLTVGTMGFNVSGRNTGISFPLQAGVNTITAHSGGLIWLSFTQDGNVEPKGRAKISFTDDSEQIRAPRYVFGVTSHAEFASMMGDYPTPDVLYQSDYIAVVATRESAQQYSLNENKDEWMESIHTLLAKEDEISGMDNNDPNPTHHRLKAGEIRFLLVENTSVSPHANSGGYTGYPSASRHRYLTKLGTSTNNTWMLGHELGHQHQQPAYQFNLTTESTVNIYSYVVERNIQGASYNRTAAERWTQAQNTYLKLPFSKRIYDMDSDLLQSIVGFNRDELRFMVWEQFFLLFGDDFYKTLHRVVREEKIIGGKDDERRAYLIWKASQVSGYDLTEFLNLWGIRVADPEVKAELRARMADAKTKGEILDLANIDLTAEDLLMITGQARPPWAPLPLRGITTSSPKGTTAPIDRTHWTITTSIVGVPDGTVGGDNPENIIDGNTASAFAFIKPGRTYEGVTGPTNYIPSFTIDMQSEQTFNYVSYLHRNAGNTSEWLRARKISLYGSNDNTTFVPVKEQHVIDHTKNADEVIIDFPSATARYLRVVLDDWNRENGSTIQVAELNVGVQSPEEQLPVPAPLKFKVNVTANDQILTTQAGVHWEDEDSDYTIHFTLAPGADKLAVAVDGDPVVPVASDGAYSLTVTVANHLDIVLSAEASTGLAFPDPDPRPYLHPNPVKAGQPFTMSVADELSDAIVSIYNLTGMKQFEQPLHARPMELNIPEPGVYLIEVRKDRKKFISRIIVQ